MFTCDFSVHICLTVGWQVSSQYIAKTIKEQMKERRQVWVGPTGLLHRCTIIRPITMTAIQMEGSARETQGRFRDWDDIAPIFNCILAKLVVANVRLGSDSGLYAPLPGWHVVFTFVYRAICETRWQKGIPYSQRNMHYVKKQKHAQKCVKYKGVCSLRWCKIKKNACSTHQLLTCGLWRECALFV